MSDEQLPVPLHLLHAWWAEAQREQSETILTAAEAQVEALPPELGEAVLAEVRRVLYREHERQHMDIERVISDEIERDLEGRFGKDAAGR